MLDKNAILELVDARFGWERAASVIEALPDQVRAGEPWQVRDALGRLVVRSPEARAALLEYPPPKDSINPLSDDGETYALGPALNDSFLVDHLVQKHGGAQPVDFLDFGCGTGRLLSYLAQFNPQNRYSGCDVVEAGLDHIRASGIPGDFRKMGNEPPISFEANSFDAILAWSIFTHYSQGYADAWATELHRLLRPGGVLLMTYSTPEVIETMRGDNRPIMSNPEMLSRMLTEVSETGFGFAPSYDGLVSETGADYANFGMTLMSEDYVRSRWSERFDVLETCTAVPGWQDMAVFRKR